jgi:Nucleotidyl transferase AbiEii toxin, Type IV TA system
MSLNYLHNHKDFSDLLQIVAEEQGIERGLVEKDYWIMQALYGLKKQGFIFELKGGTSLSKGYHIIDRFSEDIDIHIKPPSVISVNENPKNVKDKAKEERKKYYDWLAKEIKIEGIKEVERDHAFDNTHSYLSGGIRLYYDSKMPSVKVLKEGILLEAGFDKVTPYEMLTISSWAYDRAITTSGIEIIDNRALDIPCYHPGYTFVEKLQTIATKYRQEQDGQSKKPNFMRQYYDVYSLLGTTSVQQFIGSTAYQVHKKERFPAVDYAIHLSENEAFLLNSTDIRSDYESRYKATAAIYYKGQPDFSDVLERIRSFLPTL